MDSAGQIFAYCERGFDPSFWAEPFNTVSNLAFIIAGAFAARELAARPEGEGKAFRWGLVGLVFAIGVGSFLFHTYATGWAATADVVPIGLFMLTYLSYALVRFMGAPVWSVPLWLAGFGLLVHQGMQLQCWPGQIGIPVLERVLENTGCLNGSLGYLPALTAMLASGFWLAMRRHGAAPYVLGASVVFMVSLTFRTMDRLWCHEVAMMGESIGTHFLWHLCNATTLYLLLLAAVRHGETAPVIVRTRIGGEPAR